MPNSEFSWIRTIFYVLLCIYSLQFFTFDVNADVMNAFIHGPNLIFHEAGHVIFWFFGDFIRILGGSLFQCLLPFLLALVFFIKEEDGFAAAVCFWWFGQNLTDVALYISDARARSLPLIGGMSEDAHDWGNLLTMTNTLQYDHTFAILTHYTGMIVMLFALIYWGYVIWNSYVFSRSISV